jgi:Tfp pilus assembly protein PilX
MLIKSNPMMMARREGQRGLVLVIVLIVLTAMMLAGIALMRSVNTANIVAGNLAFRQAATHEGDFGTEQAITWLQSQTSTALLTDSAANGYYSTLQGPASGTSWDAYWNTAYAATGTVVTMPAYHNYTVSYVIHRMCPTAGTTIGCASSPIGSASNGNSHQAGIPANFQQPTQGYFRITSRIVGPRNTVSYTQATVKM